MFLIDQETNRDDTVPYIMRIQKFPPNYWGATKNLSIMEGPIKQNCRNILVSVFNETNETIQIVKGMKIAHLFRENIPYTNSN